MSDMLDKKKKLSVAIETHGCKLNFSDSEELATQFKELGYEIVADDEVADIFVLNSCTVTSTADSKARRSLRNAIRRMKDGSVIATGCYAQRNPAALKRIDGIDLVLGNTEKEQIVTRVGQLIGREDLPKVNIIQGESFRLPSRTRAFIKIQEGCNQICAYCIVPKVRGSEKSLPVDYLLKEIKEREQEGYKEVILTGTQLGSYGFDLAGTNLYNLLEQILKNTDIPRIRVSSLQAQEINDALLQLWVKEPRLCPHFHIPLQSANQNVLARMRRRYSPQQYLATVQKIRNVLPRSSITTDVIVGFPGESESAFVDTYNFCREVEFSSIHAFPYSARPGTSAVYFADPVDPSIIRVRMAKMLKLATELADDAREEALGESGHVLWEKRVDSIGPDVWTGLSDTYLRTFTDSKSNLNNEITPVQFYKIQNRAMWSNILESTTIKEWKPD